MEEDLKPQFGKVPETLGAVAFSGPATVVNRVVVTEADGIVRISTMESDTNENVHFRGAVVMSLGLAEQLSEMLQHITASARSRMAQNG
ncbi:hypothetical protein [Paenirhodobacter populi]|uniref:DUF3467 domain-containing protein n=1 Tax=Paenirhodobacter populi TaxID=2306993 RepID=A0A443IPM2_9RHOB|nr:hypothetical protein [Sinirhodobacter populi]RWR08539.1 hypothetical protein D2T33_15705 [Sinirhodobacter populi]